MERKAECGGRDESYLRGGDGSDEDWFALIRRWFGVIGGMSALADSLGELGGLDPRDFGQGDAELVVARVVRKGADGVGGWKALLGAELGGERDFVTSPVDGGVVEFEPGDPQDHWIVSELRNVEGESFGVLSERDVDGNGPMREGFGREVTVVAFEWARNLDFAKRDPKSFGVFGSEEVGLRAAVDHGVADFDGILVANLDGDDEVFLCVKFSVAKRINKSRRNVGVGYVKVVSELDRREMLPSS